MKTITVYTMNNCAYCDAAKALLTSLTLSYKEINITNDDQARRDLVLRTGHRTMPQIFIDDQFVGGYTELKEVLSNKS